MTNTGLRFLLTLAWFLSTASAPAQNLLANPDFEDANVCVEYSARCAPEAWKEVNYRRLVYLNNRKGGKVGIFISNDPGIRTYLFTELLCPLLEGETYEVEFDLNLRGADFQPFGIYFSEGDSSGRFRSEYARAVLSFTEKNGPKKVKKMDWMPFKGEFQATGKERFFYLGYFDRPDRKDRDRDMAAIFYFDNFVLKPKSRSIPVCPEAADKMRAIYADDWRHMGFPDTFPAQALLPPDTAAFSPDPVAEAPLEIRRRSDTLVLSGICFDFDKSTLNAHYAGITDSITDAIILKKPAGILIGGHTDNIGSDDFNLKLSLARARTVEQVFISKGYDAANIRCEGFGETRPVAANDTDAGRQANRRIEIVLFFN